jgi:hypothetical protein
MIFVAFVLFVVFPVSFRLFNSLRCSSRADPNDLCALSLAPLRPGASQSPLEIRGVAAITALTLTNPPIVFGRAQLMNTRWFAIVGRG